jgi:dTDP-4-amino-4,6-dideoxygalactose transaminase
MRSTIIPASDVRRQYLSIKPEIDEAVQRVLASGEYERGEELDSFEAAFARFCEVGYAVGVGSGYAAVFLALKACGLGPGDEVLTVANTDMATVSAISHTGATPVFVDIDAATLNMNPSLIEAKLTPRTRAILPVHLYGLPTDMDPIMALARDRNLLVIEDAALADGARYRGRRAGGLGHVGALSFAPNKVLGAQGDGGAVVTNDAKLADAARLWGSYGERRHATQIGQIQLMLPRPHDVQGYHNHLDTIQAAVLKVKLKYVERWIARRQEIARFYDAAFEGLELIRPAAPAGYEHVYRNYVVRVKNRDQARVALGERGIVTHIIYAPALHLQPALQHLGYRRGDLPVTEQAADEILGLPMFPELTQEEIEYVAQSVGEVLNRRTM